MLLSRIDNTVLLSVYDDVFWAHSVLLLLNDCVLLWVHDVKISWVTFCSVITQSCSDNGVLHDVIM